MVSVKNLKRNMKQLKVLVTKVSKEANAVMKAAKAAKAAKASKKKRRVYVSPRRKRTKTNNNAVPALEEVPLHKTYSCNYKNLNIR